MNNNLEGKTEEPNIDVRVIDDVAMPQPPEVPTSAPQTVLSENPASFSPHNLEKAATAVRQEPAVIGFGVADL